MVLQENIDNVVVSDTKSDPTFPACQFKIPGYSMPYRRYRDRNGGRVVVGIKGQF